MKRVDRSSPLCTAERTCVCLSLPVNVRRGTRVLAEWTGLSVLLRGNLGYCDYCGPCGQCEAHCLDTR